MRSRRTPAEVVGGSHITHGSTQKGKEKEFAGRGEKKKKAMGVKSALLKNLGEKNNTSETRRVDLRLITRGEQKVKIGLTPGKRVGLVQGGKGKKGRSRNTGVTICVEKNSQPSV